MVALALAGAALAGCGKKGPPLPPLPRTPPAINDLEATLGGTSLEAAWTARPPLEPGAARVEHQLIWEVEPAGAEGSRGAAAGEMLKRLIERGQRAGGPAAEWAESASRPERRLEARADLGGAPPPGAQVQVAVLARAGRREIPSSVVTITVPSEPLPAPQPLALEARPEGILVRWTPLGIDARLELFRAEGSAGFPSSPLARAAPRAGELLDRSARLGGRYRYAARVRAAAGARGWAAGPTVEAGPLAYIDSFPPAPPKGLAVLIEGGGARLLWSPNREPDLAGYRIYRRIGAGAADPVGSVRGWEVTWVDASAPEGEQVEYRVTAFDSSPQANESAPSDPASALVRRPRSLPASTPIPSAPAPSTEPEPQTQGAP